MRKNKRKIIILSAIIIVIVSLSSYFLFFENKQNSDELTLIFKEDQKTIEYGSKIDSKTFVKEGQPYIKTYPTIDTMRLGEQKIVYDLEKDKAQNEVSYTINVVDTKAPKIVLTTDVIEIGRNQEFHIQDYIVEISDPIDGNLVLYEKGEHKGTYTFVDSVDVTTTGEYEIKINATDKNGNVSTQTVKVLVKDQINPSNPTEVKPTYIKGILLVNKEYGIPPSLGGENASANAALYQLQQSAASAGFDLPLLSGYRSYEYQVSLYNSYVERDGQEAADRYSARPGHSEHQTGLCFDVGSIDNDYGETNAGKWLAQHAHEYGFIIRFPEGKEHITGYMYEPWHVRFVGSEVAKEIYKQNITLEEYLNVYE